MENSTFLSEWSASIREFLEGQEWYQQLKEKWEELDPQSRLYLKIAGVVGALMLVLFIMASAMWSVHRTKSELADKDELLTTIQSADDELHRLRETAVPVGATNDNTPWSTYFETLGGSAGLDKDTMTVSNEKPGTTTDTAKESLYDIALKHVSIRNVVRLAFSLESGARPVKIRNLAIDTKADPTGYMDATISVSAFTMNKTAQ